MKKIKYYLWALCLLGCRVQGTEMNSQIFFPGWDLLEAQQKEALKIQMEAFDVKEIERQRSVILESEVRTQVLSVFNHYEVRGNLEDKEIGKKMLMDGKVGCLIVAGGQGSRLNYTKPKGLYPVTLVKKKCLFQLFAEKILAAGKQVGRSLDVAIMTSSENHEETLEAFKENNYFGLSTDQLFFFSQKDLPFLDSQGNLFLEKKDVFATGPDGNASSLKQFVASGIWDVWHKKGISYLNYMHIDNALADPFDSELTGFHSRNFSSDVIVKCIQRENPEEKLGVMFEEQEKVVVVEYSEISPEEKTARREDGGLKNACANIGLYSFSMNFIYDVANSYYDKFPFHKAWKSAKYLSVKGVSEKSEKPIAWKFEKFIFDVLPFAQNVKALLYPRNECFAPLKNAEGDDSLIFVQKALQERDRKVFEEITGTVAPLTVFELDLEFYYPTLSLLENWKGKTFPETSYISP